MQALHFIEYDAGVASLAGAAMSLGLQSTAFDKQYCDQHDKMTPHGFRLWVSAMMHVRHRGNVWWAPDFGSSQTTLEGVSLFPG